MLSFNLSELPQAKRHQLLLGAISPRPIAFVSTLNEEGVANLAPYSFFNIFSSNPPVAVFSPARRGRDNTTKHTYENIKKNMECVINIVNYEMAEQMSLASTEYAAGVNEFEKAGFTPLASEVVKPPRVKESPAQLECVVKQVIELGTEGGAGNLILCEIVRMHFHEDVFGEDGKIDPIKMDQVSRMGGHWYSRAKSGLFQIEQPTTQIGIGFDNLPEFILHSKVLTGSQLAKLAGVTQIPDETSVNEYKLVELSEVFIELEHDARALEQRLHEMAAEHLDQGRMSEAWMTLLAFND
jgi:flavin reductase (DIM6/NTAB) family NADH-FMN oxidoreductase RutF